MGLHRVGHDCSNLAAAAAAELYMTRRWSVGCLVISNSLRPHGLHAAHQAPPSMGFSRQEYWSGVPLPSPIVPLTIDN